MTIIEPYTNLENYDGRKAYFGSEKYLIFDIEGIKYALPADMEVIQAVNKSKGLEKERLQKRFPFFQILNEFPDLEEARAVRVNFKRDNLMRKLAESC